MRLVFSLIVSGGANNYNSGRFWKREKGRGKNAAGKNGKPEIQFLSDNQR